MDHQFKIGDVVQLKSGGPRMTIEDIDKYGPGADHDRAKCVWFEKTKRMEEIFELHSLTMETPHQLTVSRA